MKTFTAKVEGKQTKIEIDDTLTLGKLKQVLRNGLTLTPGKGAELDLIGLYTGILSVAVKKPAPLRNIKYIESLDLTESAEILKEVQKILPLKTCLDALEPILGTQ